MEESIKNININVFIWYTILKNYQKLLADQSDLGMAFQNTMLKIV